MKEVNKPHYRIHFNAYLSGGIYEDRHKEYEGAISWCGPGNKSAYVNQPDKSVIFCMRMPYSLIEKRLQ